MDRWHNSERGFPKMHTVYPNGITFGSAMIKHIGVSKADASIASIRAMTSGRGSVREGDVYAQLYVGGTMWMSDTHDEQRDHHSALWHARGEVLIGGLGLGMVALGIALKSEVTKVTVIELNADVIALVEPHLRAALVAAGQDPNKLVIVQANVFEWKPAKGQKFDTMWWDIWATLCEDDISEHSRVNRRYARNKAEGCWTGCWGHEILLRHRAHTQHEKARWGSFRSF
jgi:hypothetical protein